MKESRLILADTFPHSTEAVNNGEVLINMLTQENHVTLPNLTSLWSGKSVAFHCLFNPPEMTIHATASNTVPVKLSVHFLSPRASKIPIVTSSCILGTVTSINVQTHTIYIEAKDEQWIIISTG